MCSFHCYEDLPTCGEGGIRTHGGCKTHNGFRDRPIRPLWHLSCFLAKRMSFHSQVEGNYISLFPRL